MKKYLPSIVTCLNLLSGACACILALWGYFWQAWCFILAGAVFDLCDGALARLVKAVSPMGRELDSLADVISFGLAPALMLFTWYFKINCGGTAGNPLAFVPLLLVAFSALRLARFNTSGSETHDFCGLPTPACAMIGASAVAYGHCCTLAGAESAVLRLLMSSWFIPALSAVLCVLLVSHIRMFSLKSRPGTRHYILAGGALLLVAGIAFIAPRGIPFIGYAALFTVLLFTVYILLAIFSPGE
ncbi:MAG: CDP-diacylglycerol--serine O-phosphatidyltransferase [Bacteroidales bacterium]|nr:CDP-diacylglycerol--serine O-phosphatidyltransferase [Bacteroidales bacterium]